MKKIISVALAVAILAVSGSSAYAQSQDDFSGFSFTNFDFSGFANFSTDYWGAFDDERVQEAFSGLENGDYQGNIGGGEIQDGLSNLDGTGEGSFNVSAGREHQAEIAVAKAAKCEEVRTRVQEKIAQNQDRLNEYPEFEAVAAKWSDKAENIDCSNSEEIDAAIEEAKQDGGTIRERISALRGSRSNSTGSQFIGMR